MPDDRFWLYDWIDTFEVKDVNQAQSLLEDPGLRKDLRKRAAQVTFSTEEIPANDAPTIVAGRAIDLSGELDCFAWECMKKQVDRLFSHVWHYFDRIVIVGPSAHAFSSSWNQDTEPQKIERLLTYIRLLLYIRDIGAEDLLVFRQKRPACEVHLEDHLKEVGMEPTLMLADKLIEPIASKAEISTRVHNDHLDYMFTHPEFEHSVWGAIKKSEAQSEAKLRHAVTESVFRRYLANLASDVWTAQTLSSPLGSTVNFHGQLLSAFKAGLEDAEVAFNLELPILKGISPENLLKIRRDEHLHFEKFRQSLRLAIRERLENASGEKADEIADEIRRDVINPSLSDIELRLKAAKKAVAKKAGLGLTLGALVTTCGLLTLNPVIMGIGITTAVGGAVPAGHKFIEETRDIELSDMYFLWQAQKHSKKHKHS